ncbi:MAG: glycosyltransferase family 2 protein [archaeon]
MNKKINIEKKFADKLFYLSIFLFIFIFAIVSAKFNLLTYFVLSFIFLYFTIVLILAYFFYQDYDNFENSLDYKKENSFPSSVAAVTYAFNNFKSAEHTIKALINLEYPHKFKVYVITDGTCTFLNKIKEVNIIKLPKSCFDTSQINLKARVANEGFKHIKAEYILFVDGDTIPNKNALKLMVNQMITLNKIDNKVAVVNGILLPNRQNKLIHKLQTLEYALAWGLVPKILSLFNSVSVALGGMFLIKRSVFEKLGGYDESNVTEDREFGYRLLKNGYKLKFAPNAFGTVGIPNTFKQFFTQRVRWCRGETKTICDYKDFFFNRKLSLFGLFILPYTYFIQAIGISLLFRIILINLKRNLINIYYYVIEAIRNKEFFIPFTKYVYLPSVAYLAILSICLFIVFALVAFSVTNFELKPNFFFAFIVFSVVYGFILIVIYIYSLICEFLNIKYSWTKSDDYGSES